MGTVGTTHPFMIKENAPSALNNVTNPAAYKNLTKSNLGGVIFGCKNSTMKECLSKKLFGLPAQHFYYVKDIHFYYVKDIDPGLPLFLFNYSDRKLHGIFKAASSGQLNINPHAWSTDGSERTQYPAQVQVNIRKKCRPLLEHQFKPIIIDNHYYKNHFWFELDHAQTSKLLSLFSPPPVASRSFAPQTTAKWRIVSQEPPSANRSEENEGLKPPNLEDDYSHSIKSIGNPGSSDDGSSLDGDKRPSETWLGEQVGVKDGSDLIYMKLEASALNRYGSDLPFLGSLEDSAVGNDMSSDLNGFPGAQTFSEERHEESLANSSDYRSIIAQVAAEIEIQQLKDRCMMLEAMSNFSMQHNLNTLIVVVGGYDGVSHLSALDYYSPSHDVIKSLNPMKSARSFASVAKLNGELYVFGGDDDHVWYDTAKDEWTSRPSLNEKKGGLAGATLDGKIFAIGGVCGNECFSGVEMYDIDVGRWIFTRSMLQKRFALAAAELNGALYAVGGYDGKEYLGSAERFDPREHSWTKIGDMNTKRGSHSLVVLNEKIYAIGGYDGIERVLTIEIYDPRLGSWITGEPMNHSRGYFAAAVLNESIYIIGGVGNGEDTVETVERYEEGKGWQVTNLKGIGKRCYCSAIVL